MTKNYKWNCLLCNQFEHDKKRAVIKHFFNEHLRKITERKMNDKLRLVYFCPYCNDYSNSQIYYLGRHITEKHDDKIIQQDLGDFDLGFRL